MSAPDDYSDRAFMLRAACRGADPRLFFPDRRALNDPANRKARSVCARCPVKCDCDAYAIRLGIKDGIWGGRNRANNRGRAGQPHRSAARLVCS